MTAETPEIPAPRSWDDVTDLASIEDHIEAMVTADSAIRRVMVLGSAQKHYLGGIRLLCSRHPHSGEMTFAELRRHTAKHAHEPGDVTPAGENPQDFARTGDRSGMEDDR